MGYFSWNCLACGFSLRECKGCSEGDWMGHAVVLAPNGSRVIGHYDGYGRVGDTYNLANQLGDFSVYHKACWEIVGKPEFTKQAGSAADQGACHKLHGQPFPLPTKEWIDKAKTWQVLDRVLQAYAQLLCDLDYAREEKLWGSLSPERQLVLCGEYETDKCARRAANKARWEEYLHSEIDEEMPPDKEPDPATYKFDGVVFDYMWLGHFISMAKNDR